MAIQLLPNPTTSALGSIGQGVGQGLQKGLEALAKMKMDDIAAQKRGESLERFFPGLGKSLSALSKADFSEINKNYDLSNFAQQLGQRQPGQSINPQAPVPNVGLKRKITPELEARIQNQIEKNNEPFYKIHNAKQERLNALKPILKEWKQLEEAGLREGAIAGSRPNFLNTADEQRANELWGKLAAITAGEGQPGALRSKYQHEKAVERKPSLYKKKATRQQSWNAFNDEVQEGVIEKDVVRKLIDDNGGKQPKNLDTEVVKAMHKYRKLFDDPELNITDDDEEGAKVEDKNGKVLLVFEQGYWRIPL